MHPDEWCGATLLTSVISITPSGIDADSEAKGDVDEMGTVTQKCWLELYGVLL